ncbi:MAG: hypothetical protein AAGF20_01925 [Pseudomonadota bacterium]
MARQMSPALRRVLIILAVFIALSALVIATAYSVGADPLHPRSRHIWLLSLVAAAYASFRVVTIVERALRGWEDTSASGRWPGFMKKEHAIDKRMAERRARVEAAKAQSTGDDRGDSASGQDGTP